MSNEIATIPERSNRLSVKETMEQLDAFYACVGRKQPNGCILWLGPASRGYGHFNYGGGQVKAHRFAYALVCGDIPDGMKVLHNCPGGDNPTCINPAHLFLGTQRANVLDMMSKGCAPNRKGEAHGRAKRTDEGIRRIRQRLRAGDSLSEIARDEGVSKSAVARIGQGKGWKHV